MSDEPTNVVSISDRLPKPDAELVETLRTILSEAQNARITGFAGVYVTTDGDVETVYHFSNSLELVGAVSLLQRDAITTLTE